VVLGLAQLADGPESALRFYRITNTGPVGFFANSNHHAMFLAMALPFVVVGCARALSRRREAGARAWLSALGGLGLLTLLVLGIALTASRAGVGLGLMGMMLATVAALVYWHRRSARGWLATALVVGGVLVVQVVLVAVLQLAVQSRALDERYRFSPVTLEAAQAHAPLGAGLGGFVHAFETFDRVAPGDVYANHAHNDYAELWLDGGWPALLIALLLMAAFLRASWQAWRPGAADAEASARLLRKAASIALLLVIVHSLVDYPLRTTAHLALFGLLAACLTRPPSKALKRLP
jgi:O-antigen ligase